jgi:hypothetical protein
LILWKNLAIVIFMGRQRKDPALRMSIHLRVPVTPEQQQIILDATSDEPNGFAAWARTVLLDVAKRRIAKRESERSKK